MREDYIHIYDVIRDKGTYASYIYNKSLYAIQRPILKHEPELIAEDIICYNRQGDWMVFLHHDKIVGCDMFSDKSVTFEFGREPFKVVQDFEPNRAFVGFVDGIVYIDFIRKIKVARDFPRPFVTDVSVKGRKEYMYIYDGEIYSSRILSTHITIATLNRKIYKFFDDMPIFETGFVYNGDFIDVGRTPTRTLKLFKTALSVIDGSLYQFIKAGDKVYCGLVHDKIDDIFYDSVERSVIAVSQDDTYCIPEEELNMDRVVA